MKKITLPIAIFLVIICTFFTSAGQIFFKLGTKNLAFDLSMLSNYNLIAGLLFYATGAVLLVIALKGGELSVLYPIVATSYIWVSLMAFLIFNESLSVFKIAGIAFIMLGISFIGRGSR